VVPVITVVLAARSAPTAPPDPAGRGCGCGGVQDDQKVMGWFSRNTEADMGKATLTEAERITLSKLEAAVEAGVTATLTVIEAGKALQTIRNRQLYRDTATTWDDYVQARFRITRRRADQLVSFAGVQDTLEAIQSETGTTVPTLSERAVRPLVGMDADTIKAVVAEAASTSEGVTAGSIRKAASKRKPKVKVQRPRRFKVPGAIVTVVFNRKSNGSTLDALAAASRQAELELESQAGEAA
jgi:hypothetical protein